MSQASRVTAEDQLASLRFGCPWQEVLEHARRAEDGERNSDWADDWLIEIYKECLTRGLTFQSAPDAFLDVCKRLSRLLFRYGRAREANNFLLQLRDLSPNPADVPAWAWAYSAKLSYLEDLEYCIRNPREVIGYLQQSISIHPDNLQANAVLADFVNTAVRHFLERSHHENAEPLYVALRTFLDESSLQGDERIEQALEKLYTLLDEYGTFAALSNKQQHGFLKNESPVKKESERSKADLEEPSLPDADLARENAKLRERNQALAQELHALQEKAQKDLTSVARLDGLIERLEAKLQWIREERQASREPESQQLTPNSSDATVRSDKALQPRTRIIILGESRAAEHQLRGICKSMGLNKEQIEFRLSYDAFDSVDIGSLQYNDSIAGVLIGPVPHKVPGIDDPVQALMQQEGFPPTVRVETKSGELKITKSSFRDSLDTLLTRIASLEPATHIGHTA